MKQVSRGWAPGQLTLSLNRLRHRRLTRMLREDRERLVTAADLAQA